ncbi:MAG TPA: hypothetical protein VNX88_05735 [Terriglobales bacterium]|jgi:hypothetical protein|nr:hypothetical protein [Terriglobales bacterium]
MDSRRGIARITPDRRRRVEQSGATPSGQQTGSARLTLAAQRVADGRVLRLIKAMLKAGSYGKGQLFPTERGTPQGGVVTPLTQKVI